MQLLNTYDDRDEAKIAEQKIVGECKVVSDREDNQVIYKLFANATWGNLHNLGMFNLAELKLILEQKKSGQSYDQARHKYIISMLQYSAKSFDLNIPAHWL